MIKFEKVSFEQFKNDVVKSCTFPLSMDQIKTAYENIKIPTRATKHSAGYDFYAPFDMNFTKNFSERFPTGIRCQMDDDVVLLLFPRSSLGFKYGMQLDNSTGVIDADYYNAKNEGHIQCKMHFENFSPENKNLKILQGEAYMQGIFINYLKTIDDNSTEVRNGGIGSSNKPTTVSK